MEEKARGANHSEHTQNNRKSNIKIKEERHTNLSEPTVISTPISNIHDPRNEHSNHISSSPPSPPHLSTNTININTSSANPINTAPAFHNNNNSSSSTLFNNTPHESDDESGTLLYFP
jgi:hypothetical protein